MEKNKTFIIAEAGVNHNGCFDLAKKLIEKSAEIGADAVKFQMFNPDLLAHPNAAQAEYQKEQSKSNTQHELLSSLTLEKEDYVKLKEVADQHKIQFLVTPFDFESLDFLINLGLPYIKISSGDLTYGPLLLRTAQKNQKIIISTGMATLEEVKQALCVLAYGYCNSRATPKNFDEIKKFCTVTDWKSLLLNKVIILHCTSQYPAPLEDINLNILRTLICEFSLDVGYSDHSKSLLVPCLAVALGAKVIEKHITLDNTMEGPDHKASLNIESFRKLIRKIRKTEDILGDCKKKTTKSEFQNRKIVRRGIYAGSIVSEGHRFSMDDFRFLRPETDLSPMQAWNLVGTTANKDYQVLDKISQDCLGNGEV